MSQQKKKYTLYKSAEGSGPKPCAFYGTPSGCRNGEKCIFLHGETPTSVISNDKKQKSSADKSLDRPKKRKSSFEHHPGRESKGNVSSEPTSKKKKGDKKPKRSQELQKEKKTNRDTKAKRKKTDPLDTILRGENSDSEVEPEDAETLTTPETSGNSSSEEETESLSDNENMKLPKNSPAEPKKQRPTQESSDQSSDSDDNGSEDDGAEAAADTSGLLSGLALPVSPFSFKSNKASAQEKTAPKDETSKSAVKKKKSKAKTPEELCKTWEGLVELTRQNPLYSTLLSFNDIDSSWVSTKASKNVNKQSPKIIAIDCEMCESEDPVSKEKNEKELVRVSIVRGFSEVDTILDSLVRPLNTVTDYRSKINGIGEKELQNVTFTLRHAQAALLHLISEDTIIVGHAIHNDLSALKFKHDKLVDTALLYKLKDHPGKTPGLRDICKSVLGKDMDRHHDSVYDAKITFEVAQRLLTDGIKEVEKTQGGLGLSKIRNGLLIHRIPKQVSKASLMKILARKTFVLPKTIGEIERKDDGSNGKTMVTYSSIEHADLAFDAISGAPKPNMLGYLTKRIYLKSPPTYIQIRQNFPVKQPKGSKEKDS